MDFKRLPFHFQSTDPAKRQAELEKRFGLNTSKDKMYIDYSNIPGKVTIKGNFKPNSPRLQHRVPIFQGELADQMRSVEPQAGIDGAKQPRIRNVPIEIEGGRCSLLKNRMPFSQVPNYTVPAKMCNIPVKVIHQPDSVSETKEQNSETDVQQNPSISESKKKKTEIIETEGNCDEKDFIRKAFIRETLKKIEAVITKVHAYKDEMENFSGTVKDKKYRYLDEMLTRCMIELDAIETYGCEEIRLGRKTAIKEVQACTDFLDSKGRQVAQELNQKVISNNEDTTLQHVGIDEEKVSTDADMTSVIVEQDRIEASDLKAVDAETKDQIISSKENKIYQSERDVTSFKSHSQTEEIEDKTVKDVPLNLTDSQVVKNVDFELDSSLKNDSCVDSIGIQENSLVTQQEHLTNVDPCNSISIPVNVNALGLEVNTSDIHSYELSISNSDREIVQADNAVS